MDDMSEVEKGVTSATSLITRYLTRYIVVIEEAIYFYGASNRKNCCEAVTVLVQGLAAPEIVV